MEKRKQPPHESHYVKKALNVLREACSHMPLRRCDQEAQHGGRANGVHACSDLAARP